MDEIKAEPLITYKSESRCRDSLAKISTENELLPRIGDLETENLILKQRIQNLESENERLKQEWDSKL